MVKRKRSALGKAAKKKKPAEDDQDAAEVSSDADSLSGKEAKAPPSDGEDEFFETADEKRVRLAKEYLGRLSEDKAPDEVREQLDLDVEEQAGRRQLQIEDLALGEPRFLKGHKGTPTCVCLSSDEQTIYTGGKDCAVLRWDVETGKKDVFPGGKRLFECGGHFDRVQSICLIERRNLLVSAGADRVLRLWDPRTPPKQPCIEKLLGHAGPITALAADPDGTQIYSGSTDKSLKVWDVGLKRVMDTLFGHVSGITSMDIHSKNRVLTGGADKTVRLWKLDKDTHLVLSKHAYSVDAVALIDHDRLLSGSQDGSMHLWSPMSKKPLATTSLGSGCWVTALAAIRRGNVAFSGSVDGALRTWRLVQGEGEKGPRWVLAVGPVQMPGSVNAIAVGRRMLVCAVGQEHRLGRWFYNRKQKDGVVIVPLSYREG